MHYSCNPQSRIGQLGFILLKSHGQGFGKGLDAMCATWDKRVMFLAQQMYTFCTTKSMCLIFFFLKKIKIIFTSILLRIKHYSEQNELFCED